MDARLSRALNQPLYLVEDLCSEHETAWKIMGNSGTAYRVGLPLNLDVNLLECECMDHQRRKLACKHILFVLHRVLRLPLDEPIVLEDLRRPTAAVEPRELDDRQECPICFESLKDGSLVFCFAQCRNSVHSECYAKSVQYGRRACPYCRCDRGMVPNLKRKLPDP